jgi:hypothetical protein
MPPLPSIGQSAAQYKTVKTLFTSTNTPTKMIAANPNRVALILSDNTGNVNFGTVDKQPSTLAGLLPLGTNFLTIMLTFEQFGPFVQEEFWSCRISGSSNTGIVEIIYVPTS